MPAPRAFAPMTIPQIQAAIASGRFERITAVKDKPVHARQGKLGERISTLVESPDGLLAETDNVVSSEDQLVLTHPFEGFDNSYIVSKEKFQKLYHPHPDAEGRFAPVGEQRVVYRCDADIRFLAPWGADLFLLAGGVVVPEPGQHDAFYGINPKEFAATHSVVPVATNATGEPAAGSPPRAQP